VFEEADSNFDGLGLNHKKKGSNELGRATPTPAGQCVARALPPCGGEEEAHELGVYWQPRLPRPESVERPTLRPCQVGPHLHHQDPCHVYTHAKAVTPSSRAGLPLKRSQREKTKRRCLASSPPSLVPVTFTSFARPLVRRRRRLPARPPVARCPPARGGQGPPGRPLGPPRRQGNRRLSLDRSSVSRRSAGHAIASRRGAFSIPLWFGLGGGRIQEHAGALLCFFSFSFWFSFRGSGISEIPSIFWGREIGFRCLCSRRVSLAPRGLRPRFTGSSVTSVPTSVFRSEIAFWLCFRHPSTTESSKKVRRFSFLGFTTPLIFFDTTVG